MTDSTGVPDNKTENVTPIKPGQNPERVGEATNPPSSKNDQPTGPGGRPL